MAWNYKDVLELNGMSNETKRACGLTVDMTMDANIDMAKIFKDYVRNVEAVVKKAENAKSRKDLNDAERKIQSLSAKFEDDYYRVMAAVSDYKRDYEKVYDRAFDALGQISLKKGLS